MNRRATVLLLCALVALHGGISVQGQSALNGHTVKLDSQSKLLAWTANQANAYDQVLSLATNYLLTGVPKGPGGLPYYFVYSYADPTTPLQPATGWPHNPAGLYAMLTDSGTAYYAYSGNVGMMNLVRDVLTYQLDHGMTPSTWAWPNVAFASSDGGSLTYQGAHYGDSTGSGDGFGVIQPDKVAEVAVAFLQYYQYSGATRFRDAAIQAADVLVDHIRTGDSTHSPWPFRVYGQTDVTREQYTAHVISSIRLFDNLIRLGLGDTAGYQTARQTVWNWLMAYPLKNNVWSNYFEDVPIQSDTWNTNQLNAAETARYLMQHPESDPNWQTHVRGIISWIETNFGSQEYGATRVAEQLDFKYPMGSHTSRYASLNAQLYELTGDQAALDKAFRSFNWASYMCGSNGVVIDGPQVNHVWWTDGYGDYIKHFLEGLGAVPQWAPPTQSHLLRSTSIVRSIQYNATEIDYTVADTASQETFRLAFTPESISVDGTLLPNLPALTQEGWTYDSTTGALRLRHDSGTVIRVSGSPLTGNLAPTVTLDTPSAGTYTTTSLVLSATAGDPDGVVDHVDFVANGLTVGTATSSPYQMTWAGLAPGNYVLAAAAVDNVGARTVSTSVAVSVSSPALPSPPTGLTASVAGGTVNLVWTPPTGTAPARYALYRSTTTGFAPGASNLIAQPTGATYADVGLGPGTYFYRVAAVDASGGQSQASNEASATIAGGLSVDKIVYSDGSSTRTSPGITTAFANELVLAFASSDGPTSGQSLAISGGGLNWTLVTRVATQPGTAEIWKAMASGSLSNVTITATQSKTGYHQSLTVVTFAGSGGVGVVAGNSGTSAPTVSLTSSRAGSLVYGVGNDWDRATARTVGSSQTLVHQWVDTAVGDTFWVQARTTPVGAAGTTVQLNDTAPTSGRWNFAAVEVLPVVTTTAAVPNVVGLSQPAAQTQITSAGLALGTVTQQASATVPVGTVISQNPAAGTQVSGGTAVALVVSSGPQQVAVPNVVGLTQAAAQNALVSAGLSVGPVTMQTSSTVAAGNVISQTPAGGTQVSGGSAVALLVSSGSAQVAVPNVVGLTQVAAQTQITGVGLAVGTVTQQANATVPVGAVISQNPVAGTQVAPGGLVDLVISTGSQASVPTVDITVFSDGSGTRTTAAFSTTAPNELLLAFVASDGSASGTQSATVSGVGLTWRLVRRINAQHGTSEIWQATALTVLSNVTVTSTQVQSGYRQSLTVVAFKGTSGVGASAGSSATGGTPFVQLTTTRSNSLIYGVGNDWDRAMSRTTGSGQALIHQVIENTVGDTFWVQARTTPTASVGATTQISDTAPTGDRWNLVSVEIVP